MDSVIVSGGAGFIGSNFVHLAIDNDWFDQYQQYLAVFNLAAIPEQPPEQR